MQKHWIINNWNKTRHTLVGVRGRRCLATADHVVHYVNLKMLSHDDQVRSQSYVKDSLSIWWF
jgi:hypothetical protein